MLGSDLLYREWGYVALSRAREGTHLYTVAAHLRDATRTLAADLADSHAQQLASDLQPPRPLRSAVLEARAEQLKAAREHARRDAAAAERQLDDLHRERDALGPLRRLAGAERGSTPSSPRRPTYWTTPTPAWPRLRRRLAMSSASSGSSSDASRSTRPRRSNAPPLSHRGGRSETT